MLSYATIGSNDLDTSVPFWTELLGSQGVTKLFDHPRGGTLFAKGGKLVFGILTPFDMDDRAAVDAFHAKAIELGASDEGAPGERGPNFYMAYFRDPEGHKFCACKLG